MQQTVRKPFDFLPKVDWQFTALRLRIAEKRQISMPSFSKVAGAWIVIMAISAAIVSLGNMGRSMSSLYPIADAISNIGFPAFMAFLYFTKTQEKKQDERKSDLAWIALALIVPQFAYYGVWILALNSTGGNMAVLSAFAAGLFIPVGLRYIRPQKSAKK